MVGVAVAGELAPPSTIKNILSQLEINLYPQTPIFTEDITKGRESDGTAQAVTEELPSQPAEIPATKGTQIAGEPAIWMP